MGDLVNGDVVFSDTGETCRVIRAHPVVENPVSYRIVFDDGAVIDAGAEHLWLTYDARELAQLTRLSDEFRVRRQSKRPSRTTGNKSERFSTAISERNRSRNYHNKSTVSGTVRSTADIAATLRTSSGRCNHAIPVTAPLQLPPVALPIDPYVLGAWLGDGTTSSGSITIGDQDADATLGNLSGCNENVRLIPSQGIGYRIDGLTTRLRRLGVLNNKHIPSLYLRSSYDQRLSMLQGLMDTDGHAKKSGSVEFTTTLSVLADAVAELVTSLGSKVAIRVGRAKIKGVDCGEKYRLTWTAAYPVFRLDRKLEIQKRDNLRRTIKFRYIVSCEKITPVPMRCITVDSPSRLYLAGKGMVPTHNTFSLLMEPLRHVNNPGFVATIFRRTSTQVRNPGGLWTESRNLYSQFGATARQALLEWEFPSGATIRFGHMEHADDRHNWQGAQIAMLGFDELAHFSREQFLYMLSRNRSASGIRPYVRCTLNPVAPDDPVGGWVHEFLQWFIGDDGYAVEERCGVLRYFVNYNDRLYWFGSEEEALEQFPDIRPKTFTFIKSSVFDNQILLQTDPGYLANLQALAPIDKARLLGDGRRGGNWLVREEAGTIFNRSWVHPVSTFKREKGRACLFWDFAATEKQLNKPDPDYTAGVMLQEVEDEMGVKGYTVLSCIDFQLGPAGTDEAVIQHTREAASFCAKNGIKFCVRWEIEPGSAGKRESRRLVSTLAGLDAGGIYSRSDKIMRGKPFTAQAAAGNVSFLMANWNETWLQHMHNFPSGAHDDIWDATSGSFNTLAAGFALRKGTMRRG